MSFADEHADIFHESVTSTVMVDFSAAEGVPVLAQIDWFKYMLSVILFVYTE